MTDYDYLDGQLIVEGFAPNNDRRSLRSLELIFNGFGLIYGNKYVKYAMKFSQKDI